MLGVSTLIGFRLFLSGEVGKQVFPNFETTQVHFSSAVSLVVSSLVLIATPDGTCLFIVKTESLPESQSKQKLGCTH